MFTAIVGIAMVSPLLPVYVREDLNGPEIAVALSFSALAVTQFVVSPFIGRLGDRFGFKPFIVLGFGVYGAGALGYVIANSWEMVVFFRAMSGIGAGSIFPMAMAYVGRLSPPDREGRYMGVFAIAMSAGFALGPLMGGILRDAVSADAAFISMASMLFGVGGITLLLLPPKPPAGHGRPNEDDDGPSLPWQVLVRQPIVQATVAGQTIVSVGWGAGFSFVAVYVISDDGLATGSAAFVGILIAARSLAGSLLQTVTGMLADKYNRSMLAAFGLIIGATGQFFVPDVPGNEMQLRLFGTETTVLPWLLALFLVIGIGEAISWPAIQAILVDTGRSVGMGSMMGLGQMGQSLGFLGGSLAGAAVVEIWGLAAVFRYAGLVVFFGAVVFLVLMQRAKSVPINPQAIPVETAR